MQQWSRDQSGNKRTVGFVPTMGALHSGHAELIRQSSMNNDVTVVSIFVNPTQFNVQDDFDKYPRTFDMDVQIASESGAHVVFAPTALEMYPTNFRTFVEPGVASDPMEGEGRPGHFRGVATIVVKLLNAVSPSNAYFGKKDYQQLAVVRETVDALNMTVNIVGIPTVREADGLALSSRNVRLSHSARSQASVIFRALTEVQNVYARGETNRSILEKIAIDVMATQPDCRPEYATICDRVTLKSSDVISDNSVMCVAAWFDDVRLIDNLELHAH